MLTDKLSYSIQEAINLTSLGKTTLYKARKAGALKMIKMGRRTVILADDLRRFLESAAPT